MTWENNPWMVTGADTTAAISRVLAYAAVKQSEGVVGPSDCKVTASAIPDGNVHIQPGAIGCLNRYPGGASEAYLVRNEGDEVKALTPQGAGGVRHDLVCVVVEDPAFAGQPQPPSIENGPYVRTRVYEDVPASTRFLYEIDPDQTGYAVARVKFNASDGTVNASDITDLRQLLMPRQKTETFIQNNSGQVQTLGQAAVVAPAGASWDIDVPDWATRAIIKGHWSGVQAQDNGAGNGQAFGSAQVRLDGISSGGSSWRADATGSNKPVTLSPMDAAEIGLGNRAGSTVRVEALLDKNSGAAMDVVTNSWTTVVVDVVFKEALL